DADRVYAGVAVEVGVLGGDGRGDAGLRDVVERHGAVQAAARVGGEDLEQQPALPVVDARVRQRQAGLEVVDVRQAGEQPRIHADAAEEEQGGGEEKGELVASVHR